MRGAPGSDPGGNPGRRAETGKGEAKVHCKFITSSFAMAAADLIMRGRCPEIEEIARAGKPDPGPEDRLAAWERLAASSSDKAVLAMGRILGGLQRGVAGCIRFRLCAPRLVERLRFSSGWGPLPVVESFSGGGAEKGLSWEWTHGDGAVCTDSAILPEWLASASCLTALIIAQARFERRADAKSADDVIMKACAMGLRVSAIPDLKGLLEEMNATADKFTDGRGL